MSWARNSESIEIILGFKVESRKIIVQVLLLKCASYTKINTIGGCKSKVLIKTAVSKRVLSKFFCIRRKETLSPICKKIDFRQWRIGNTDAASSFIEIFITGAIS